MRTAAVFFAAVVLGALGSAAYAMWSVADEGTWPKTWPKELEPLRKQARSAEGGLVNLVVHEIPFTTRADFESAWPHILKVKSKGAPLFLRKGPDDWLGDTMNAGVRIHCPPPQAGDRVVPEGPLPGDRDPRSRWMYTTFIELVVDGVVVDLNRIPLPAETPLIDERPGVAAVPGGPPVKVAEAERAMGMLDVGTGDVEMLALSSEAGPVRLSGFAGGKYQVSAGRYAGLQAQLAKTDATGAKWRLSSLEPGRKEGLEIRAGETLALKLGPPLKAKIEARAVDGGRVLISLSLEGQAGETYSPRAVKGNVMPPPPKLKILDESGKAILQGNFEYG